MIHPIGANDVHTPDDLTVKRCGTSIVVADDISGGRLRGIRVPRFDDWTRFTVEKRGKYGAGDPRTYLSLLVNNVYNWTK
jgi:hypothetical protein